MNILFISHEASLTGAPLILLNFARWLREHNSGLHFEFLLLRGGEMEKEFSSLAETFRLYSQAKQQPSLAGRLAQRIFKKDHRSEILAKLAARKYDIIYANTVATMRTAVEIADACTKKPRLILHMHELDTIIRQFEPGFGTLEKKADCFIAVSEAVRKNLVTNHHIAESRIRLVHEFIDSAKLLQAASGYGNRLPAGAPPAIAGKFIVGGSGTVHWRKGSDLFLQVAQCLFKKRPSFNGVFVWIGAVPKNEKIVVDEDIRKMQLADKIFFPGVFNPPYGWFHAFDVFLMTSREDPFPIVSLETACLGKPLICFRGAGGTEEMVASGGGVIVPYMDVEAMADAIIAYSEDPRKKEGDGALAASAVANYDISLVAPRLLRVIEEFNS